MTWNDVHADTVPPFVTPEHPSIGDLARIRLRVANGVDVESIHLRSVVDGVDHHTRAVCIRTGAPSDWYEAEVEITQNRINFSYLIRTSDHKTRYLNRAGLHTVYQTDDHDYVLSTDRPPDWVRSAVFYQIFPDRFFTTGKYRAGDGELKRGRFVSRRMGWADNPLAYEQGGSLDFFGGDLPGIEGKLDYLLDLGISALYLNPIFTAMTNHRYDCIDYFAVDPQLGGDNALISLVQAAHQRGMKIILDVSLNHIGAEHEWSEGLLQADGSTEEVVARDSAGNAVRWAGVPELLKLDYRSEGLRRKIFRDEDSLIQRYLKPPFQIDGWRFDVASETGRYGSTQLGDDLWREIRSTIRSVNPQAYIVGELWQDSLHYLGDMWDSAMNYFASGRPARMWMGEQDRFAVYPVRDAVCGRHISGDELALLINQHFTRVPDPLVHCQFNLLDSHDVVRFHNNADVFDWELYEGAIMLLFLFPGTFNIYYGDEIGIGGSTDGDHGKRHPMEWREARWDTRFVALYRMMSHLKAESPVLHRGSSRVLESGNDHLVYARFTVDEYVVLVLSRHPVVRTLQIDLSAIGAVSASVIGSDAEVGIQEQTITVTVGPRRSALIHGAADVGYQQSGVL